MIIHPANNLHIEQCKILSEFPIPLKFAPLVLKHQDLDYQPAGEFLSLQHPFFPTKYHKHSETHEIVRRALRKRLHTLIIYLRVSRIVEKIISLYISFSFFFLSPTFLFLFKGSAFENNQWTCDNNDSLSFITIVIIYAFYRQ